jgi:hypothetical protein
MRVHFAHLSHDADEKVDVDTMKSILNWQSHLFDTLMTKTSKNSNRALRFDPARLVVRWQFFFSPTQGLKLRHSPFEGKNAARQKLDARSSLLLYV